VSAAFDVDSFLAQPVTAHLATAGPRVRPVWFLWEDGSFWILTGPWSRVAKDVAEDPNVALVVDTCDLGTGEVKQVVARGMAELLPYDRERGFRKLSRYMGEEVSSWDERFSGYLSERPDAQWLRLRPTTLTAHDLSYTPSSPPR